MSVANGNLGDRRVLLCVCGGIAAYKSAELVRRLRDAGSEVTVAMTDNAQRFIGAQTFRHCRIGPCGVRCGMSMPKRRWGIWNWHGGRSRW